MTVKEDGPHDNFFLALFEFLKFKYISVKILEFKFKSFFYKIIYK